MAALICNVLHAMNTYIDDGPSNYWYIHLTVAVICGIGGDTAILELTCYSHVICIARERGALSNV